MPCRILTSFLLVTAVTLPVWMINSSAEASLGGQLASWSANAAAQAAARSEPAWVHKVVETRIMGAKVRTEVQRRGGDLRGVVYIYPPFSPKETYHFTGKIEGDSVRAAHVDGHEFRGRISPDRWVEGTLTTNRGRRIPLKVRVP